MGADDVFGALIKVAGTLLEPFIPKAPMKGRWRHFWFGAIIALLLLFFIVGVLGSS